MRGCSIHCSVWPCLSTSPVGRQRKSLPAYNSSGNTQIHLNAQYSCLFDHCVSTIFQQLCPLVSSSCQRLHRLTCSQSNRFMTCFDNPETS